MTLGLRPPTYATTDIRSARGSTGHFNADGMRVRIVSLGTTGYGQAVTCDPARGECGTLVDVRVSDLNLAHDTPIEAGGDLSAMGCTTWQALLDSGRLDGHPVREIEDALLLHGSAVCPWGLTIRMVG